MLLTCRAEPAPQAVFPYDFECAIYYDSLGVLGDKGRDFWLGDDGVAESRKSLVRIDDGGGDAVKQTALELLDGGRGKDVCHGHLRVVFQFPVVAKKQRRGTRQHAMVGNESRRPVVRM